MVRARSAGHDLVYCCLDVTYLKLRPDDEAAEGVLVGWGLTSEGRKVLLRARTRVARGDDDWLDFGRDCRRAPEDPRRVDLGRRRQGRIARLAADYRRAYPSAMRVIDDNVDQLVAHSRFPLEQRKRPGGSGRIKQDPLTNRRSYVRTSSPRNMGRDRRCARAVIIGPTWTVAPIAAVPAGIHDGCHVPARRTVRSGPPPRCGRRVAPVAELAV